MINRYKSPLLLLFLIFLAIPLHLQPAAYPPEFLSAITSLGIIGIFATVTYRKQTETAHRFRQGLVLVIISIISFFQPLSMLVLCILIGIALAILLHSWKHRSALHSTGIGALGIFLCFFLMLIITPGVFDFIESYEELSRDLLTTMMLVAAIVGVMMVLIERADFDYSFDPIIAIFFTLLAVIFLLTSSLFSFYLPHSAAIGVTSALMLSCLIIIHLLLAPLSNHQLFDNIVRLALEPNVGFEEWIMHITKIHDSHESPQRFIDEAMALLKAKTGCLGLSWHLTSRDGAEQRGSLGQPEAAHEVIISHAAVSVTFMTKRRIHILDWFNYTFLVRVIAVHYHSKQQSALRFAEARERSVYEVGAKITHDIKNILHALMSLFNLLKKDDGLQIAREQLPVLSERLDEALNKLSQPKLTDAVAAKKYISVHQWWREAKARYHHEAVVFSSSMQNMDLFLWQELFDRALDNFLANALQKQKADERVCIDVALSGNEEKLSLIVRDTGGVIPDAIATLLFISPITDARAGGMGIGLFQLNKQARSGGYSVALLCNEPANVSFLFEGAPAASPADVT